MRRLAAGLVEHAGERGAIGPRPRDRSPGGRCRDNDRKEAKQRRDREARSNDGAVIHERSTVSAAR